MVRLEWKLGRSVGHRREAIINVPRIKYILDSTCLYFYPSENDRVADNVELAGFDLAVAGEPGDVDDEGDNGGHRGNGDFNTAVVTGGDFYVAGKFMREYSGDFFSDG